MTQKTKNYFSLEVPVDASKIDNFKPDKGLKVLVIDEHGECFSNNIKLEESGKGSTNFSFQERPGSLKVYIGPDDAEDDELMKLETISVSVNSRNFIEQNKYVLNPIKIPMYYWNKWLFWCRYFTITGKVTCPDSSVVAGAKVCAKDVGIFWWWFGVRQVGCAITDHTGAFTLRFRWCCGWRPYYWWLQRHWQLEPQLVNLIQSELRTSPSLKNLPSPTPQPDLNIFREFVSEEDIALSPSFIGRSREFSNLSLANRELIGNVDMSAIENLKPQLLTKLPHLPASNRLKIWPWRPWYPWWDCQPDIIFSVTQICNGVEETIVNESIWDTRYNIPTHLNVNLVANNKACCIEEYDPPVGNCINLTHICSNPLITVAGNLSAPTAPVGYQNPGGNSTVADRPFAGVVSLHGDFGTLSNAHYYEVEWKKTSNLSWNPMPAGAYSGISRSYYGPQLPNGIIDTYTVPFSLQAISGRNVIETRQHFENSNGAGTWNNTRWWNHNLNHLGIWNTNNLFSDGAYDLRIKTWELSNGNLVNPQILDHCGSSPGIDNNLKIRLDNRHVGSGSVDSHGHPCGAGTVHTCTTEPDTEILGVQILKTNGTLVDVLPCGGGQLNPDDTLIIDFSAHDPEGHLALYTLRTTYGNNLARNLLTQPSSVLTPSPSAPGWAPATSQVGPYYATTNPALSALAQGAVSPIWRGGSMRLTLKASDAFPVSCCYQLELRAYKRTIVNCSGSLSGHTNYTEYSFNITV